MTISPVELNWKAFSPKMQEILHKSADLCSNEGKSFIDTAHVMKALLEESGEHQKLLVRHVATLLYALIEDGRNKVS